MSHLSSSRQSTQTGGSIPKRQSIADAADGDSCAHDPVVDGRWKHGRMVGWVDGCSEGCPEDW